MIQRRRWHKPGRVVVDSAAPATTYAISRSPFGRPRSLLPRPGWAVPFGRAHLSAPPRVLVKGSWSSIQPPRAEAVAVAAILPRLVHPPGRSRISREYSQDGHLLRIKDIFPYILFVSSSFSLSYLNMVASLFFSLKNLLS